MRSNGSLMVGSLFAPGVDPIVAVKVIEGFAPGDQYCPANADVRHSLFVKPVVQATGTNSHALGKAWLAVEVWFRLVLVARAGRGQCSVSTHKLRCPAV